MSRNVLIEAAFDCLLVGMLLWQPLRDFGAIALLGLLLTERSTADDHARDASLPRGWAFAVGAFLAANVLSALASTAPRASLAQLRFYPLGLLIFLGGRRAIAAGASRRIAGVVVALVTLFALDEMLQVLAGSSFLRHGEPLWGRFQGALVYPSDVSLLPILLPIGASVVFGRAPRRLVAGALLVGLVAAAVSLSGTRAALGALLIFGAAVGWIHGRPWIALGMVVVALGASLATAKLGTATVAQRVLSPATYRSENRIPQWRAAMVLFREAPILGQGPHSFRDLVRLRHEERDFAAVQLKYAPYPHDIYLEALCGTGVVGFAALIALLTTGAGSLLRLHDAGAVPRAALVSLGAFAAVGLFDLSLVKDWVQVCFWLPLAFAAGLTRPAANARSATSDDAAATTGPPLPR